MLAVMSVSAMRNIFILKKFLLSYYVVIEYQELYLSGRASITILT